ncbi:MAG: ATP-binding protein [Treponema sp.]|nr:ATP-binding protein [Treponema sp.]
MSMSPLHFAASLQIGTVDYAAPDKIGVKLDTEAPDSIAMNTGRPRPFPRINEYVLIPNDEGFMVGQVAWLTVENSAYPKRTGLKDFGLVDLPFPLRKMELNPLGTLTVKEMTREGKNVYEFHRGVDAFPSIGDPVILPMEDQLHSIVEQGEKGRVKIGTSPLAGNADVRIDPDKLFGRHLAVLGNTGSGKSCSVAGLIRWSLEAAKENCKEGKEPNARFIILDPDGEYGRAFSFDDRLKSQVRKFSVGSDDTAEQLKVPLWFWNSAEWCAFAQATEKTQRPVIRRALREIKLEKKQCGCAQNPEKKIREEMQKYISDQTCYVHYQIFSNEYKSKPTPFGNYLESLKIDFSQAMSGVLSQYINIVNTIISIIDTALDGKKNGNYWKSFNLNPVSELAKALDSLVENFGENPDQSGPEEDCPICYSSEELISRLKKIGDQEGVGQWIDFLVMRIRTMLGDSKMKSIIGDTEISLQAWLERYIGSNDASNGTITLIDLSLVPTELVSITTAVIARMVFEALQRYRKANEGKCLPTVLVMEEAHTFIKRYTDDSENQSSATMCCKVFEKIAREGRKYGLGLVLSSQRPSELSPTVLSQCNSFLLHRISNDQDQELVKCLVPDNLRSLLRDLPSLPSQNAILLGWATELPVLVKMNTLPKEQQPRSDDPDFWNVWIRDKDKGGERTIDWEKIATDWQQSAHDNTATVPQEEKPESEEKDKSKEKKESDTDDGFPEDIPF